MRITPLWKTVFASALTSTAATPLRPASDLVDRAAKIADAAQALVDGRLAEERERTKKLRGNRQG